MTVFCLCLIPSCLVNQASNQEFIEINADNVFMPINTHIGKVLHDSLATIKRDIYAELEEISALLRLSLVGEDYFEYHENTADRTVLVQRR